MYHPRRVSRSRAVQVDFLGVFRYWLFEDSDIAIEPILTKTGSVWGRWQCSNQGREKLRMIFAAANMKFNLAIKDPDTIQNTLWERIEWRISRYRSK